MSQYKQIIPASDWFYVDHSENDSEIVIYHIAAWALTEKGIVIGLISVNGSQSFDEENKMARLVTVPPTDSGAYKHKNELSDLENNALKNDGHLKTN